jgi:TolA-binding protein
LKSQLSIKETVLECNKDKQKQIQATLAGLTLTVEANNRTIDQLRNTDTSNNLLIQEQRKEFTELKGNISTLLMSQEENKLFIKQLSERLDHCQAHTDGKANPVTTIKPAVQLSCGRQEDVSTRKVEAITTNQ